MQCPCCSAPLRAGLLTCDFCEVRLAPDPAGQRLVPVFPMIRPGELLCAYNFAVDPMPGMDTRTFHWENGDAVTPVHDGVMFTSGKAARIFMQPVLRARDACVRAMLQTLEPGLSVSVFARRLSVQDASFYYELGVVQEKRA